MSWRIMSKLQRALPLALAVALISSAVAQSTYQPKFPGDPARSEPEASALGYMRTVLRAQREYKKKHNGYAKSLLDLVHTGSFTRRMATTDRGDYTVAFRSVRDGFVLTLTPKQFDAQHRAFFADDTGTIRAEEDKPATAESLPVQRS